MARAPKPLSFPGFTNKKMLYKGARFRKRTSDRQQNVWSSHSPNLRKQDVPGSKSGSLVISDSVPGKSLPLLNLQFPYLSSGNK